MPLGRVKYCLSYHSFTGPCIDLEIVGYMEHPEWVEINVGDQIMTPTPFHTIKNIHDAWPLPTEIESLYSNY